MAMLMIVPRHRAGEYETLSRKFSDIPGCQVVLDRRLVERRQDRRPWPSIERRRRERRTGSLDGARGAVIFLR
jgi:hypothetical protein